MAKNDQNDEQKTTSTRGDTIRVRTNPDKIRGNAAFYDPIQKVTIGSEPVDVERTQFVRTHLLSEELIETK